MRWLKWTLMIVNTFFAFFTLQFDKGTAIINMLVVVLLALSITFETPPKAEDKE